MTGDSLNLHYFSERDGLAPMVVGLLEGLGPLYNVRVGIEQTQQKAEGDDHDVFALQFQEAGDSAESSA